MVGGFQSPAALMELRDPRRFGAPAGVQGWPCPEKVDTENVLIE